jgi:hypothetical protein
MAPPAAPPAAAPGSTSLLMWKPNRSMTPGEALRGTWGWLSPPIGWRPHGPGPDQNPVRLLLRSDDWMPRFPLWGTSKNTKAHTDRAARGVAATGLHFVRGAERAIFRGALLFVIPGLAQAYSRALAYFCATMAFLAARHRCNLVFY